ncbi:MAG: hypothetical protein WCC90_03530 [Methylocella sp.]
MPVTSNRAVGEWGTVFGDPVVTNRDLGSSAPPQPRAHHPGGELSASRRAPPQASAKAPSGASDNACMISAISDMGPP